MPRASFLKYWEFMHCVLKASFCLHHLIHLSSNKPLNRILPLISTMVSGWRLAFCTTFPKDTSTSTPTPTPTSKPIPKDETDYTNTTHPTSRFSLFSSSTTSSTTSTPRINNLRCRTASATDPVSLSNSPKLTCKTTSSSSSSANNSPRLTTRLFNRSSPSSFSFIKSTLRLSKSTCGVCLHSVKTGQGTAIFTAECSHQFHFPCVVDLVTKRTPLPLFCPVCTATWKELPLFETHKSEIDKFATKSDSGEVLKPVKTTKPSDLKIYDDDEPLMSPTAGSRFNPIPESDYEKDDIESLVDEDSFQGFFTSAAVSSSSSSSPVSGCNNIDLTLLPDSTVISAGRGYETVAVLMEVKAPDVRTRGTGKTSSFRAPVDLVAVIDVTNNSNLQTTKRAMRVLISSLSSNDRLSIVAFSSCSKRLLPLRRMTVDGRRVARRIIDVIVATEQSMSMSAGDAVRKAAKVLEDRRVKNPVNSIIVLSNVSDSPFNTSTNINRQIVPLQATRSYHLNIPIHTFAISDLSGACAQDEAFAKSIGRLLSVPVQDLRVQFGSVHNSVEVKAVYLCAGRTKWLGSGTGSIKLGDFLADEKQEILIELRVRVASSRVHFAISVRPSYTDPSSQQLVTCRDKILPVPIPNPDPKCVPTSQRIERLRCAFIAARAVAESKILAERNDFCSANHFLTSALALVSQSNSTSAASEYVSVVEAELVELKLRRQQAKKQWEKSIGSRMSEEVVLTPTSAWRTAERLAKVARMRKSLNRVSDLHGFENARF